MYTELGTVEKSLRIHWKGRCYIILSMEEHQNTHLSLEFKYKI